MKKLIRNSSFAIASLLIAINSGQSETASSPGRILFADSITTRATGTKDGLYRITRSTLTIDELNTPFDVAISLRIRGIVDLESRIRAGGAIGHSELEDKYLPLSSDYLRVVDWLRDAGLTITLEDKNHTNIFARGSVATLAHAFGVTFARVMTTSGEATSAITAPSLPADIAGPVLSILGLQASGLGDAQQKETPRTAQVQGDVTPSTIKTAYAMPPSYDGTGQTVAIICGAVPASSDLTGFWQDAGVNNSISNISVVDVNGGPTTNSQSAYVTGTTLTTEWVSSIAPGAKVVLYAGPDVSVPGLMASCTKIINDNTASVALCNVGYTEDFYTLSEVQSASQVFAEMAAAGITMLAGTGSGGSNPAPSSSNGSGYSPSNPVQVEYPASDAFVTAVGGTTLGLDANWNEVSETTWSQIGSSQPLASGGGASKFFQRPSWQVGAGLPSGAMRYTPDVSSFAAANPAAPNSNIGGFTYLNGQVTDFIGTNLSLSVWAGIAAVTNQYRKSLGFPSLGLLSRYAYSLIGSDAFRDITTGTNGAYSAGVGYDLCTGIGSPIVMSYMLDSAEVVAGFSAPPSAVDPGTPIAIAAVSQNLNATYQWSLNGSTIPGATKSVYRISSAGPADAGHYSVEITTQAFSTQNYDLGTLSVNSTTPTSTVRLANISTRATVGTGSNVLIPGFVIGGSGSEILLIRAVGPSLQQFSVSGVLGQPILSLFDDQGNLIATNQGWGTDPFPAEIASVSAAVGAFALPAGSADCAMIKRLSPGSYTVQVSGVNSTTGVALAEIYEVSSTGTRLSNISTRAQVGTGSNILIPGFYLSGTGTDKLLVRGDGPSLSQFSVSGILTAPTISIYEGQTTVASNTGWTTGTQASEISSISAAVGAFSFLPGSADSAAVVELGAGSYTVQLSGVGGTTGVGLAELYEAK